MAESAIVELWDSNEIISVDEAKEWQDIKKIIKRFGDWVITDYGMESLALYYPIKASRLWEGEPSYGWVRQVSKKRWMQTEEQKANFKACLNEARIYHKLPMPRWQQAKPLPVIEKRVRIERPKSAYKPKMTVSMRDRFLILKRDGYRCKLCGRTTKDGVKLHIDHIVARSKGGTSEHNNLHTLCEECNLGKGTLDL